MWGRELTYWTHLRRLSWCGSHELQNRNPWGTEKCVADSSERRTLPAQRVTMVSRLPKEAHSALHGPPKDLLHSAQCGFIAKEERLDSGREARKGPAWELQNPHSGGSEHQGPEDTEGDQRCHKAVLLLKLVLTFKMTGKGQAVVPCPGCSRKCAVEGEVWLSTSNTMCLGRTLAAVLLMCKGLALHHYEWSIFFHKKCTPFLWNSPPRLCHRLGEKQSQEHHNILIRANQNRTSGTTCPTSYQSKKAAVVPRG